MPPLPAPTAAAGTLPAPHRSATCPAPPERGWQLWGLQRGNGGVAEAVFHDTWRCIERMKIAKQPRAQPAVSRLDALPCPQLTLPTCAVYEQAQHRHAVAVAHLVPPLQRAAGWGNRNGSDHHWKASASACDQQASKRAHLRRRLALGPWLRCHVVRVDGRRFLQGSKDGAQVLQTAGEETGGGTASRVVESRQHGRPTESPVRAREATTSTARARMHPPARAGPPAPAPPAGTPAAAPPA